MKKLHFLLAGAATLALAACGGRDEDTLDNLDANETTQSDQLNALADDAANRAEAEALGAERDQLEQEQSDQANEDTAADVPATENPDENVSGM